MTRRPASCRSRPSGTTAPARIGVLLVNLGTPDAPTPAAVRRYLAEFLSDRRVVEIPRVVWQPILHGVILRMRPAQVGKKVRDDLDAARARRCSRTASGRGRCSWATSGSG